MKSASPLIQAAVHLDYDAHGEYEIYPFEGEGTKTVLLCSAFHFENPGDSLLLQCLPKVTHIPGEQGRMSQSLQAGNGHASCPVSEVWVILAGE